MDKNELFDVLSSQFWKDVKERIDLEKEEAINDLISLNLTDSNSLAIAIKYQSRIEVYDSLNRIIDKMKEEALEEVS
jgi:molybdopterin synthase catalytic subunit